MTTHTTPKRKTSSNKTSKKIRGSLEASTIGAWDDDPMSVERGKPETRAIPELPTQFYAIVIKDRRPNPKVYKIGTPEFRYWNAVDALKRCIDFWSSIVPPGTDWQSGSPLSVILDADVTLNAYYERGEGLQFFHQKVNGRDIFAGDSPDVLSHELGHAVLDSIRPQLWDEPSDEVAAFHESFGDISSICSSLQIPSYRKSILAETGPSIYQSSRLSRLAEQLGWGIRQLWPDRAESDCLRNAVNSFTYQSPLGLHFDGPSGHLSTRPHSFSRVFTGAFFRMLANMFAGCMAPTEEMLQQVAKNGATMLVYAVQRAAIVPNFYREIALGMLEADANSFNGQYAGAIQDAFQRHGIIPPGLATPPPPYPSQKRIRASMAPVASMMVTRPSVQRQRSTTLELEESLEQSSDQPSATSSSEEVETAFPGSQYGLKVPEFFVATVNQKSAYKAEQELSNPIDLAKKFVAGLFALDSVDVGQFGARPRSPRHATAMKTHKLIERSGRIFLVRKTVNCGLNHW